jgi:hypothetical protein
LMPSISRRMAVGRPHHRVIRTELTNTRKRAALRG